MNFQSGTAGVWRVSAVNEAGGWKDRTTVEDMDLAIRASLKGWKFVYLGDVQVHTNHGYPTHDQLEIASNASFVIALAKLLLHFPSFSFS